MAVLGSFSASVSESLRFSVLSVVFILRQYIRSSSQFPSDHLSLSGLHTHLGMKCTTSNFCAAMKEDLGVCLLQNGQTKENLMAIVTASTGKVIMSESLANKFEIVDVVEEYSSMPQTGEV